MVQGPDPRARRPARRKLERSNLSGVTEKEIKMNATSASQSSVRTGAIAAVFAAALGLGMVFMTGLVQASSLHDAAHDVRHATGFPCH